MNATDRADTTKQDIDFWNSDESLKRYFEMEATLWDSESSLLISAVQKLNKKISDIKVLDLGCGGGRTTIPLHNMGFQVIGIDIADVIVHKFNKKYPNIDVRVGDACKLDFESESFDIIIFSHNSLDCLYPFDKRMQALQEISRTLKPNGFYLFSSHVFNLVPYNISVFKNILRNFNQYLSSPQKGYYDEQMDNGDMVKLFYASKGEIIKELESVGMKISDQTRIVDQNNNLFETFVRSALNWERYYLAQKIDADSTETYKNLFEGRFVRTFDRKMSFLEKLYFAISPSTHNEKTLFELLSNNLNHNNNKMLDVGCGGGHTGLTQYGDVYGIDVSSASLENARRIYHEVKEVDVSGGIPYPDDYFDAVFCSEVFGHIYVNDKDKLLSELKRVLKPEGYMFFSIETYGENILTNFLKEKDLFQKYWIDYHGHIGLETPSDTVDRLEKYFTVVSYESTSSHLLPIDGYLTFREPYPIFKILENSLLRRILNIMLMPIFYFVLVMSPLSTSNDLVCLLKNDKSPNRKI